MNKLKQNVGGILLCLFEILVGILLLIDPVGFTAGIIITTGIILTIIGIASIIRYFKTDAEEAAAGQSLVIGLSALLGGIFCTFRSHWFVVTFPVLTILYGVAILLTGLVKVQLTVDMLRFKKKKWFLGAIGAALSIICAIVILCSPFTTTAVLWMFTGASLIVESIFDIITLIISGGKEKEE